MITSMINRPLRTKLLAAVYLLISLLPVSAQKLVINPDAPADTGWMPKASKEVLKSMGLSYTKPDGFREDQHFECFEGSLKLRAAFTCLSNRLVSKDGEVVIYMPIYRILTKRDSVDINRIFKGSIKSLNHFHTSTLKHQIKQLYSESAAKNWKDYVTYYSAKDTESIFNADTAISCIFTLNKPDIYKDKYRNVYSLSLQKHNKGFVNIIVFYSDKGKRRFKKYKREIEQMLRYEN